MFDEMFKDLSHPVDAEIIEAYKYAWRKSGVNFINILLADFALADPESAKKTDNLTVFSEILRSVLIKAGHRRFMILTNNIFVKYYLN